MLSVPGRTPMRNRDARGKVILNNYTPNFKRVLFGTAKEDKCITAFVLLYRLRSRKQKQKDKPDTMHVPTLCDWFSSSASACDLSSGSLKVFTLSQTTESRKAESERCFH